MRDETLFSVLRAPREKQQRVVMRGYALPCSQILVFNQHVMLVCHLSDKWSGDSRFAFGPRGIS